MLIEAERFINPRHSDGKKKSKKEEQFSLGLQRRKYNEPQAADYRRKLLNYRDPYRLTILSESIENYNIM